SVSLSALARLGFVGLTAASAALAELSKLTGIDRADLVDGLVAADPDAAVSGLLHIARRDAARVAAVLGAPDARVAAWRMLGVSSGIAGFFARRPDQFDAGALLRTDLPDQQEMTERLLGSVDASEGFARADRPEAALRVAYRRCLAEVIAADM